MVLSFLCEKIFCKKSLFISKKQVCLQEISELIMENPLVSLKIKCIRAGVRLSEACEKAGVPRQTVENWGRKMPKTFEIYLKIQQAIEELEKEKAPDK
jgi:DNA-binding transcriptional regulator YiaG